MSLRFESLAALTAGLLCAPALGQNDECTGAIVLTSSTPVAFDTSTATVSAPIWPCAMGGAADLWYTYTATSDGSLQFSTCGSSYDTSIEVFDGTCANLNPVLCNDDSCGTQSELILTGVTMGDTYFVRVGGFNGAVGAGTIVAEEFAPILPTGSIPLWLNAVQSGTPASYVNSGFVGPIEADIGATNGTNGVSYEFVVYGDNTGLSNGLMGSFAGVAVGLKFEQYADSDQYGITEFGVVDLYYTLQNNTPGTDVHLVFVVDVVNGTTKLYENGVGVGTLNTAPVLAGLMGIGQIHRPGGNADVMARGQVHGVAVYEGMLTPAEILAHRDAYFNGSLGTNYCSTNPNSTGATSVMSATGSAIASANNFTATASNLPPNQFGVFVTSRDQGFVANAGGSSNGNLCLGGAIGRFFMSNQILSSGGMGEFSLQLPLTSFPQGNGFVAVLPGDTWNFQAWHRDGVGLGSNFTDGLEVQFQ